MKKISIFFTGAVLLLALFSVSAFKTSPVVGPSVNGQGALDVGTGRIQHFSFHAITDENGNVTGSFEVKSAGQDLRMHGTITCLQMVDDKTAFMSGMITQRVGDGFPGFFLVGEYVYFEVQDNGNGGSGDKFSDVYPSGQDQECGAYGMNLFDISYGNIQVRP